MKKSVTFLICLVAAAFAASVLPALSLPFWQADWAIAILPVLIAGMSTAYAFWRLTNLGVTKLTGG